MPVIPPEIYETWRRFLPYSVWSSRIIEIWNSAVTIKSSIRFATKEYVTAHEAEYRSYIRFWRESLRTVCGAIRRSRWEWIYVDIRDIRRAEFRTWLPFIIEEGTPFEVVCDQTDALFDDCLKEIEEKIVVVVPPNKLVALHKRWFYESRRGGGHDVSIEGIATIIIPGTEKKEDYERDLEKAMKAKLLAQTGFERLDVELIQEVLGFESKYTDESVRDIKVEEIRWAHRIVTRQLTISEYL